MRGTHIPAQQRHGPTSLSICPRRESKAVHLPSGHAWLIALSKRIFLLGPSHHFYFKDCALSQCTLYGTPLGDLVLDVATIKELLETGKFGKMSRDVDEDEHSLEMHLPYIYKTLSMSFSSQEDFPRLIPILVGNTSTAKEREYGAILAPYLEDPTSVFIVSSDFCHWGLRFNYTYYLPKSTSAPAEGVRLSSGSKLGQGPAISDSIDRIDHMAMDAIESGTYPSFLNILQATNNTVCGRHPIGIVMCALETLKRDARSNSAVKEVKDFKFVRYERSSQCTRIGDSSVSYASAFAAIHYRPLGSQTLPD